MCGREEAGVGMHFKRVSRYVLYSSVQRKSRYCEKTMNHFLISHHSSRFIECKSTLDIVFALPIADSIPKEQLSDAKKFIRGIIDGLTVSPQGTHVGLLGYFDYPRVELKLDTFYDREDILRALSAVSTVDGFNNTRIDSALKAAQADMFSEANGVRAYVPKVLVFLASGDASNQDLKAASMPLKLAGTTIIPLVVGNLETKAVAPMGTSTRHYFASDTFDNLASKLDEISKKLCAGKISSPCKTFFYFAG